MGDKEKPMLFDCVVSFNKRCSIGSENNILLLIHKSSSAEGLFFFSRPYASEDVITFLA